MHSAVGPGSNQLSTRDYAYETRSRRRERRLNWGTRSRRSQRGSQEVASERNINLLSLRTHAYFPWRWRTRKETKLCEFQDNVMKGFQAKLLRYSQDGMPKNPGPLPTLLAALVAIESDYLQPWESLRHPEYIDWLTDHVDSILTGSDWSEFVMWAEAAITRLQKEKMSLHVVSSKSEPEESTMLTIIQVQMEALQQVKNLVNICHSDMDGLTAEHQSKHFAKLKKLRDNAIDYMKIAAEYYWMEFFKADPTEAVHEQVLFKLHQWRCSTNGVNDKKRNGHEGFQYRQMILANLGKQEDPEELPSPGRFEDAEKTISDDDEELRPRFHRFDIHKESRNFVMTAEMARPDPAERATLKDILKHLPPLPELSEDEQQQKIPVARTTQYSGTLNFVANWQMQLDNWKLAAAKERNLGGYGDRGSAQQRRDLDGKTQPSNDCKKTSSKRLCQLESLKHAGPSSSDSGNVSKESSKAEDREMSTREVGRDNEQPDHSTKKAFDVSTEALTRALTAFDDIDRNIQLMGMCFKKEKDTVGNQVSFTLNENELQQRTRFEALSYVKAIAWNYDPARFSGQPQRQKEHWRKLSRKAIRRKGEESQRRIRWVCKEAKSEIKRSAKAVKKAVDAITKL